MSKLVARSWLPVAAGLSLGLPFLLLNAIVASRVEPINGWIRGAGLNDATGFGAGFFFVLALLLLMLAGAIVALLPSLRRSPHGVRSVAGIATGGLLLVACLTIGFGLGQDVYRCDILQVTNCD